jgi:hypothetical protein
MALVRGVILRAASAGSMQNVSGFTSQNTGTQPHGTMAVAVAWKDMQGTSTSSPGARLSAP